MQDMFFKFVGQCVAIATTFLPKPCGWNYFHSFHVIQIKPGGQDWGVDLCARHVVRVYCKILVGGTTSTVLMQIK